MTVAGRACFSLDESSSDERLDRLLYRTGVSQVKRLRDVALAEQAPSMPRHCEHHRQSELLAKCLLRQFSMSATVSRSQGHPIRVTCYVVSITTYGYHMCMSPIGPAPDSHVPTQGVMSHLESLDWGFADCVTNGDGHAVHPYPAKFPPQLPAQLIESLTDEGDLVLDPFVGSGTSVLEAIRLGRRAAGVDANPVATRLTRVKANGLNADERDQLQLVESLLGDLEARTAKCRKGKSCPEHTMVPEFANPTKWFAASSIHELAHLREVIGVHSMRVRDVLELAIGQTAARVSFQESETRYVSAPRHVEPGSTIRDFARELRRMRREVERIQAVNGVTNVIEGDARSADSWAQFQPGGAALVVTSPPYPNAYDYHLYHRFRILWTGADPRSLRRVEVGSHLRQQTVTDPGAEYERDMHSVLEHCLAAIRPGGWCAMVVGDGIYKGKAFSTSASIAGMGEAIGFELGGVITRALPAHRRSVTAAGRRLTEEQIVILRKPFILRTGEPHWRMAPYERDLAQREMEALNSRGDDPALLTFAHTVELSDGRELMTQQARLELTDTSRRKNSTYATHGIHRYKGKFYPQLGRCLINLSCARDSVVLDPFTGSGTVALEAALSGHRFHGIELSPVGAATAKAKVSAMHADRSTLDAVSRQLDELSNDRTVDIDWSQFAVGTHDELDSWFAPRILARVSRVLAAIQQIERDGHRGIADLARVCLSDQVRRISDQDPTDLRIRRRKKPLIDAPVEADFLASWHSTIGKVAAAKEVLPPSIGTGTIVEGDSTNPACWPHDADGTPTLVDAIVSSPPYAAALPYLDTDRLSLAAIFGRPKTARKEMETQLVGSREITKRDQEKWQSWLAGPEASELLPTSTLSFLAALKTAVIDDPSAGFRKQQTPAVLTRYFLSMSRVLKLSSERLRPGGQAWFVLGDSSTTVSGRRWTIPTTTEIEAIAKHHGLESVERIPITVTRENMKHAKHAITDNTLLHFRSP